MTEPRERRRRPDLPFRRVALVLSGGGALGAYEVGVLRVLEEAGIRPAILAGVSVGAINAVLWLAHDFHTAPVERVWSRLSASSVGMRWLTLILRMVGAMVMAVAAIQILLTLVGSPELSPLRLFIPPAAGLGDAAGPLLDALAWLLVGVSGLVIVRGSLRAEEVLARLAPVRHHRDVHRWFGRALAAGLAVHLVTWLAGIPWPHRFSATLLLLGTLVWLAYRAGSLGDRMRRLILRLMPETGGRGLWGSDARRRLIQRVVAAGDPARLVHPGTHLVISACAIESGDMCYFVNWKDPAPEFVERIDHAVGRVVPLQRPEDVIEATIASSALPGVFEPVRIGGHDFVDGGVFSNQPLHAVLADGADAIVVVLVSPGGGLPKPSPDPNLIELAGRLLEIANWRNLQTELRALPAGWSREPSGASTHGAAPDEPARMCVIEPERLLPGGIYGFSPANARELRRRGVRDAWRALEAAGWLVRDAHRSKDSPTDE